MTPLSIRIKTFIWKYSNGFIPELYYRFQLRFNPRILLNKKWEAAFGYPIDWKHPRDINEIIQYLLVNSDTSQWSRLADKILVRDYVKDCGLEDLLIPLLGVWKSAQDIDFESLPNRFALKCNHDSGSTMIIDKSNEGFDAQKIRSIFSVCLKRDYGLNGELHYRKIKRRILAEQVITDPSSAENEAPVDYKVWCFNGKPHHIWACYGRTRHQVFVNVYDLDWNCHPELSIDDGHYRIGDGHLTRPVSLPSMLNAAEKLSHGFPEVRVDFYDINGHLYFGEMTFTSMCGRMKCYTPDFLKEMGRLVVLKDEKA